jgi:F0F1-type ATP synthase membrane subunit b/b'
MNALKRKMDEGTSETRDSIAQMKKETQDSIAKTQDSIAKTQDSISQMKKEFHVQLADAQKETQREMQALKQELQGQLAEIMQILRSRPSA